TDSLTAAISTLSLHDALPIYWSSARRTIPRAPPTSSGKWYAAIRISRKLTTTLDWYCCKRATFVRRGRSLSRLCALSRAMRKHRSEEHTSELQSLRHLVCRLL